MRNAACGYVEYFAAVFDPARFCVTIWYTVTNAEVVTVLKLLRQT